MKRALDFLREHNEVALATVGGGGTPLPRLRIFQIMRQEDTTLYFATSAQKAVYSELQQNPNIEILAYAGRISVRCVGKVHFDVEEDVKKWIYGNNPVLPRLYSSYDKLVYFSLPISEMDYYDLAPTPPLFLHFDLKTGQTATGFVGKSFSGHNSHGDWLLRHSPGACPHDYSSQWVNR